MKRKDFLRLIAFSILAASCKRLVSNTEFGNTNETILIIGAGIAGLGAARKLYNAGYEVTVLEGRDRIGGRLWTSREWDGIPVDLGASWIHGIRRNPITKLAEEANLETAQTDYENGIVYDTNGTPATEALIAEMEGLAREALAKAKFAAKEGMTLLESIEETDFWIKLSARERRQVLHILNTVIEHELAGSINEIDAVNPDDADVFRGEDVIFPDGYSHIAEYLAKDLDIRLEQIVEQVTYGGNKVIVQTNQDTFTADRVVVTLPIGVLQKGSVQFDPPLSTEKQDAIKTIGAGLLDKLFLRFPFMFWDSSVEILDWISAEHGRWNEWLNIAAYTGQPVLLGFNAGDYARQLHSLNDTEIVDDAMRVLRTIYGMDIPDPEDWQLSRWGLDPFAFCAYSFNAVGASAETRNTLAKPVDAQLFFAGEATSEDYPATVHGAYLSGLEAASEIMDQELRSLG